MGITVGVHGYVINYVIYGMQTLNPETYKPATLVNATLNPDDT